MGWDDKVHNLLGHCTSTAAFGTDAIYVADDYPEQAIRGVWSDTYTTIDPETGVPVMSSEPNIGVRMADLLHKPKKNEIIKRRGDEYRIRIIEPDGQGGATLVLEKMKNACC